MIFSFISRSVLGRTIKPKDMSVRAVSNFVREKSEDIASLPVRQIKASEGYRAVESAVNVVSSIFQKDRKGGQETGGGGSYKSRWFEEYEVKLFDKLDTLSELLVRIVPDSEDCDGEPEKVEEAKPEEKKQKKGSLLASIISFLSVFLANLLTKLWKSLIKIIEWFGKLMRMIVNLFKKIGEYLIKVIKQIVEGLSRLLQNTWKFMKSAARSIATKFGEAIESASKFILNKIIIPVRDFAVRMIDRARSLVARILEAAKGFFQRAGSSLARQGRSALEAARKVAARVSRSVIKGLFRGIVGSVRGLPLIGLLASAIFEGIDRNQKIEELQKKLDAGQITEQQFKDQSLDATIQAVMNAVVSTIGGSLGAVGGFLVAGPLGAVGGSVVAGLLSREFSDSFLSKLTPTIRKLIRGEMPPKQAFDEMLGVFQSLPEFLASLPEKYPQQANAIRSVLEQSQAALSQMFGGSWNAEKASGTAVSTPAVAPVPPPPVASAATSGTTPASATVSSSPTLPGAPPEGSVVTDMPKSGAPEATGAPVAAPPATSEAITEEPEAPPTAASTVIVDASTNVIAIDASQQSPQSAGRFIPDNLGARHG